ncbi:hepatitis A virus cellular receptor 1 homolog [Anguilla anguilla]|uniref:hepatitis A virus cellular receptor 1 homolog n=1 Tax=Anguilla anguilla TaxID=7936 RepID=UPI0015B2A193|nr:hepatitis A virus cellular receptor 1 homolog [Anguilla anguilla]
MNALYSSILLNQMLFHLVPVCEGSMQTLIGKTGESVTLPCHYDVIANGPTQMCWGRGEVPWSKCSNTIVSTDGEKVTFSESDRYRLLSGVQKGDVSLTIINVTENDSGIYGCRVEISGWFNDLKLNFNLTILKGNQGTIQFTTTENAPDRTTAGIGSSASAHSESPQRRTDQSSQTQRPAGESSQTALQAQEEANRRHLLAVILVPLLLVLLLVAIFLFMMRLKKQNKRPLFWMAQRSAPSSVFYVNFDSTHPTPESEKAVENIYQCDDANASEAPA